MYDIPQAPRPSAPAPAEIYSTFTPIPSRHSRAGCSWPYESQRHIFSATKLQGRLPQNTLPSRSYIHFILLNRPLTRRFTGFGEPSKIRALATLRHDSSHEKQIIKKLVRALEKVTSMVPGERIESKSECS